LARCDADEATSSLLLLLLLLMLKTKTAAWRSTCDAVTR